MFGLHATEFNTEHSKFFPHRVVMYGLQNRDYLQYNISALVFITETVCVYCAVQAESLNAIHDNFPIEMLKKASSTSLSIHDSQPILPTDTTQS